MEKLKNEPFALIGVNSDSDKDKLVQQMKDEGVTWRSFWNGPKGTSGPISTTWNVHGWPTLYFIDHKGVIRARDVRDEAAMEKLIDELIVEAKKDATK
ncbi:MAG: hypothetical protein IPJ77_06520 [Planctomycetes bacterium]|nr:hypothetical protein [Planctomycetota bacterium]